MKEGKIKTYLKKHKRKLGEFGMNYAEEKQIEILKNIFNTEVGKDFVYCLAWLLPSDKDKIDEEAIEFCIDRAAKMAVKPTKIQ